MFGNHAHGEVGIGVRAVFAPGQSGYPGDDRGEQVGLIDVVLAL